VTEHTAPTVPDHGITDEQRVRRLALAYQAILDAGGKIAEPRTADRGEFGDQTRSAANEADRSQRRANLTTSASATQAGALEQAAPDPEPGGEQPK
jgi:hypothetical protein